MPDWLLVLLGLAALVAGAEALVRGGSRLAATLGVPPVLVGLTVVSIGTSAPELAIGVQSALAGEGGLAVGNIAGTNVVNLLLILGLSAAIRPLELHARTIRLDLPAMVLVALLVTALAQDGALTRLEGLVLVALALAYTLVLVRLARRERPVVAEEYAREYGETDPPGRLALDSLLLLGGIAVVVLGSDLLVDGASGIARAQGVSEAVIGLTIVAVGTSAPELVTTLVSTVRGDRDIAVGNLLGSSVFNLLLILGATAAVADVPVEPALRHVDLPVMTLVALLCVPVFRSGRRVNRAEGLGFVALYGAYLAHLLLERV